MAAGQRLSRTAELHSPEVSSCWGPVSSPGSYMAGGPLGGSARLGLGGSSSHVRKIGLPSVLIGGVFAWGAPFGCGFGVFVRFLVTIDPVARLMSVVGQEW